MTVETFLASCVLLGVVTIQMLLWCGHGISPVWLMPFTLLALLIVLL
jgi:hypothetical protein